MARQTNAAIQWCKVGNHNLNLWSVVGRGPTSGFRGGRAPPNYRINARWYNDVGVATIHMYLRTYYEGVAKHVVRRDTITMAE